jgi:hypothetical protein
MVIPIPYAQTFTATTTGSLLKIVQCEKCSRYYGYELVAKVSASDTSFLFLDNEGASSRAVTAAETKLLHTLEASCLPVPCPTCGWYQQNMILRMRGNYLKWMRTVALWLVLLPFFSCLGFGWLVQESQKSGQGLPSGASWGVWSLWIFTGILVSGLPLVRRYLSSRYDPNLQDVEERKRIACDLAIQGEDLQTVIQRRSQDPTQKAVAAMASGPRRQLVGEKCILCGKSVDSVLEGAFCAGCGSAFHHDCTNPDAAWEKASHCSRCIGQLPTAPEC